MEDGDPEQGGANLEALVNAAAIERDGAATGAASAAEKKKSSQYQPITDEAELASLRLQGLTKKGESKVSKGDLRCRPPRVYSETFFDKKLPQFRLRTVVETARAEDVVMVWAFVTGRDDKLRENEFRFETKNYREDQALIADLQALGNSSDAMVAFLKRRFGTLREPKIEPGLTSLPPAGVVPGSLDNSEQATLFSSQVQSQQHQVPTGGIKKEEEKSVQIVLVKPTAETARGYLKIFQDELLKKKQALKKKREGSGVNKQDSKETKVQLTPIEERECQIQALHKAAWEGQAKAAFDLATQLGDFNATLRFDYTPLHQAVLGSVGSKRRSNMLTAERLIDHGAEVGAQDKFGRTPLHHASRRGDLEMMDLLISKGADCNVIAKNGSTPLHCAAESGGLAAVKKLIDAGATEIPQLAKQVSLDSNAVQASLETASLLRHVSSSSVPDSSTTVQECGTALHWAARAGQDDVVEYLLKHVNFNANARDWNGTTPLQAAAREYKDEFPDRLKVGGYRAEMERTRKRLGLPLPNKMEDRGDHYSAVVHYLMAYGADKDAVDKDNRTALHVAAACGNLKCVKLLLSGNTSDKALKKDDLGYNPFMLAIKSEPESVLATDDYSSLESQNEYWERVDELLAKGNAKDIKDIRGRTALHLAVLEGKTKVAEHLISAGADVNAEDGNGATPLLLGTRAQRLACVELLLSKGADPNIVDTFGCSSLSAAALAGNLGIVDVLLNNNADANLRKHSKNGQAGDEGRTALHDAAEAGNLDVVECLIEHGANVNHASSHKKTPLHVAARYGNTDVVQVLVEVPEIDIFAEDCKGRTALKIAKQYGLQDVVDLLNEEFVKKGGAATTNAEEQAPRQPPCDDREETPYSDWKSRFILLNEFVKEYERVPAPDEWFKGYQLGIWVDLQKEKIRWDEMPEEELKAIGSVGRKLKDWGVGIPWVDWLQNVREYVAINDKLPSALPPKEPGKKKKSISPTLDVDKKLLDMGWWCKYQQCRRLGNEVAIENPPLDEGQLQELGSLRQWKWETPRDRERQRILLCLRLNLFCKKHKRLPSPDEHYLGVPLGRWCQLIRKLKLWSEISEKRQAYIECYMLDEDGREIFKGSVNALWTHYRLSTDDYLECLNAFVREHKRLPQRKDVVSKSINIGMWLTKQRRKFKKGILAAEEQQRIDELCRTHSLEPRWSLDRTSAGKSGDVEMQEAVGVAVAAVEHDEKKHYEELQRIQYLLSEIKGGITLKTPEIMELFRLWRHCKKEIEQKPPSRPAGGSTFFLDHNVKYRQDGYKYDKKESNTTLKVNGEGKLKCFYNLTADGSLKRRIYWELERPDLVFIHYNNFNSSPLKRKAFEAQLDVKSEAAGPSSMAGMDILAEAAAEAPPSSATLQRTMSKRTDPFDKPIENPDSDIDKLNLNEPAAKGRRKERDLKEKAAEGAKPSPADGDGDAVTVVKDPASPASAQVVPPKTITELLRELPVPRIEKDIPIDGNSQFAAIADQVYGDYTKHRLIRDLVVKQLRENPDKYRELIKLNDGYHSKKCVDQYCNNMEKDRRNGTGVTLQAVADVFETMVSVARDGDWNRYIGFATKPKIDALVITFHERLLHYNSTVEEGENEEEIKKTAAAAAPASSPPSPKISPRLTDTPIADLQEKGLLTTVALPANVVEIVASAPLHNHFAMSTALKTLYDHGVGGPPMRWAASHILSKKLEEEQKEYLFKSVQDYIVQGKLQEAAEWVKDMKEAWE